jgi:predicted anti-sigma-YlaC factor YlaD
MKLKKIDCLEVAKHVCGELDEHMNSAECRAIRKHLETCPNCTAYLDSLKKTVLIYRRVPNPRAPKRMRKQLFAKLKLRG